MDLLFAQDVPAITHDKYGYSGVGGSFWMPPQMSTVAPEIDWAFDVVLWISIVLFVPLMAVMLYLVVKYRARPGRKSEPSPAHHTGLEIGWTIPTIPIVSVIFYVGVNGFVDMRTMPNNAMEIGVIAQKWNWAFEYPNGVTNNELHVPVDRNIVLVMRSQDVIHAMYIPRCRVKQDIVPGRFSKLWFKCEKTGSSTIFCAEYCGTGHSAMLSKLEVHPTTGENSYEKWLEEAGDWTKQKGMTATKAGQKIYETRGCSTCHSIDGSVKQGPSFKDNYGFPRTFTSPQGAGSIVMDENYIKESVEKPDAKVRTGFQNVMPSFAGQLKDRDIFALSQYLKTLSSKGGAPIETYAPPKDPNAKADPAKDAKSGK